MKKTSTLFILLFIFVQTVFANVARPMDSAKIAKTAFDKGMMTAKNSYAKDSVNKIVTALKDSLKCCHNSLCNGTKVEGKKLWLLVFSPVILFFIVIVFVGWKFKLRDALKENVPQVKTVPNPLFEPKNSAIITQMIANPANAANLTPTVQISTDNAAPSSSRYAALITVFFGLAIITCFISIYLYTYIQCPAKPIDLKPLQDVFLALLVGIAPYGFNRLGSGLQGKP